MIAHAEPTPVTTAFGRMEITCERLRDSLNAGNKLCDQIEKEIEAVKSKHREKLERLMQSVSEQESELTEQINANRHLFPDGSKTQTFAGIEIGFQKEQDKLLTPDDATLIQRIETMLKDQKDVLIDTKKSVIKAAFKKLSLAVKKKLGCSVMIGSDKLVIRLAPGDARKRASAYLTEAALNQEKAA